WRLFTFLEMKPAKSYLMSETLVRCWLYGYRILYLVLLRLSYILSVRCLSLAFFLQDFFYMQSKKPIIVVLFLLFTSTLYSQHLRGHFITTEKLNKGKEYCDDLDFITVDKAET